MTTKQMPKLKPTEAVVADKEPLRARITKLAEAVNSTFSERDEVVQLMTAAMLSKQNLFLLGVPGTAKSAIVRHMQEAIKGSDGYQILLSKFTTPEQVFGPFDVQQFEQGKYEVLTDGYLPTAHIAFLDEIWKSSNAILNSLLTIVNERKFSNGNQVEDCPLVSVFAASNELPQSAELNALYDRFLFKTVVKPVSSAKALKKLFNGSGFVPTPEITLEELIEAQEEVRQVKIPASVSDDAANIIFKLRREGIEISDRVAIACCADVNPLTGEKMLSVIKTQAWLDGRDKCDSTDLRILCHCLWHDPEDIQVVTKIILSTANPHDQKAITFSDQTDDLLKELDDRIANGDQQIEAFSYAVSNLDKIAKQVLRIIADKQNEPKMKKLVTLARRLELEKKELFNRATDQTIKVQPAPSLPAR